MKRISDKRKALLPEYYTLVSGLVDLCRNKSELSGMSPDWQSGFVVDPHHIQCRIGKLYLDPFNIIMLTRIEHDIEEGKIKGVKIGKERLLEIVREHRIGQGYKPETG